MLAKNEKWEVCHMSIARRRRHGQNMVGQMTKYDKITSLSLSTSFFASLVGFSAFPP